MRDKLKQLPRERRVSGEANTSPLPAVRADQIAPCIAARVPFEWCGITGQRYGRAYVVSAYADVVAVHRRSLWNWWGWTFYPVPATGATTIAVKYTQQAIYPRGSRR